MPGLFQGIGTMTTALRAFQRALDVTGHNITNVNTPGYSRQEAHLTETDPTHFTSGRELFMGNGVTISSINRIRDAFLTAQRLSAGSESGRLGSLTNGLNGVQSMMLEPGGASIGDAMNAFFNSWSALGSNPSDAGLRQQVQQSGATLASRVRGMYSSLQASSAETTARIGGTITHAQDLINKIADMNRQILQEAGPGSEPNDLLDQRDQAIQELSQIMPVTTQAQANGTIWVFSGQANLVDTAGAMTLPTTFDANTSSLVGPNGSFTVSGGSLAGLFQTQQKITSYQAKLDTFANTLRTQFNAIHTTGINGLGATNQNFFQDVPAGNPQTGAINFDLDAAIKADPQAIATGVSGNPGDGGLALSMSGLRDAQIGALGNKTLGGYYADFVSGVGQDVDSTKSMADTSRAIMQQIDQQVQSVSGVSLDDEMANMMRFQRSYQAAAKALSVFDQTTEDLINIIR